MKTFCEIKPSIHNATKIFRQILKQVLQDFYSLFDHYAL